MSPESVQPSPSASNGPNCSDLVAFHKPHDGIVPRVARDYGHSLDTPPICECAAWQLARCLGEPFDRLVAVTVYRAVGPPGSDPTSWLEGSLALKLEGAAMKGSAVKREAREESESCDETAR